MSETDSATPTTTAMAREPAPDVFEIRDEEIDVARIMERIRRNVEEKRRQGVYRDEPWLRRTFGFSDLAARADGLSDRLAMLKVAARMNLEGEPITSHRRFTGQVVVWVKQWTRFWIRRYTDSIFYSQNHVNAEVIDLLTDLTRQVDELRRKVEELEKRAK